MINWTELDPEQDAELGSLLAAIDAAIAARPEIPERCDALLARTLAEPVDAQTLDRVHEGIAALFGLGNDAGRLVSWTMSDDSRTRLDVVARRSPPVVARLLRDIAAFHGFRLVEAYRRWRELPDDWEIVHREVYFDLLTERLRIQTDITKFSGEKVSLSGDADSLLGLVTNLLRSLALAPPGTPFRERIVADFREQILAFQAVLEPPTAAEAGAPAAEGAPTAAG